MSWWFEIPDYDAFDCREAVLNSMQEDNLYSRGVYVILEDFVEESELHRRIKVVHDLMPWEIEIRSSDTLWVESPKNKLPHLHTVLGVLRWAEYDYDHPLIDLAVFKTAMKMGYLDNVSPSFNWNGIHTFVDTNVPALKFYKAFQEFVHEVYTEDGYMVGRPNYSTVAFCLAPEELSKHSKSLKTCVDCSKPVELKLFDEHKPLAYVGTGKTDCQPLFRKQSYMDLPLPGGQYTMIHSDNLVKLDLLVNGG